MNINNIKEDISEFNSIFFKDVTYVIESGLAFIEAHKLIKPKEKYITIMNFLNTTINYFTQIDKEIIDDTFRKLHNDVNFFYSLHRKERSRTENVKLIFQKDFLPRSAAFKKIAHDIQKFENIKGTTSQEEKFLARLRKDYKELEAIYFENFKVIFVEHKKKLLKSLLVILNSIIYYLDRLLWVQVAGSKEIADTIKMKNCTSSRDYIINKLRVTMKYEQNYQYLQECLRVYK